MKINNAKPRVEPREAGMLYNAFEGSVECVTYIENVYSS